MNTNVGSAAKDSRRALQGNYNSSNRISNGLFENENINPASPALVSSTRSGN